MLSLPSLFLSIRLNILSVLFSGVASSSGSWTSVPIWTLKYNFSFLVREDKSDHFVYWSHYFHHFLPRYVAVTVEIIHTKYQGMVEFISIYKFKPTWTPILASGPVSPWRWRSEHRETLGNQSCHLRLHQKFWIRARKISRRPQMGRARCTFSRRGSTYLSKLIENKMIFRNSWPSLTDNRKSKTFFTFFNVWSRP